MRAPYLIAVLPLLFPSPALAQASPQQEHQFVEIILQDRAVIDQLLQDVANEKQALAEMVRAQQKHDKAVDDYWRRYTGLTPAK